MFQRKEDDLAYAGNLAIAGAVHELFLEFERMAENFSAGEIFQLAVALENRQDELIRVLSV